MTESVPSTKPYLIRAIHAWCCDNGLTPYLAVQADASAKLPREFVREGQIVLNISYEATGNLQMTNELISFQARFGGVPRDIVVPVWTVTAIYARENGVGMAFEAEHQEKVDHAGDEPDDRPDPPPEGRPHLRIVK